MAANKEFKFIAKFPSLTLVVNPPKGEKAKVKFAYSEFTTTDPAIAAGIRKHPSFKRDFDEVKKEDLPDAEPPKTE
jgi:hypothetical protein